MILLRKGLSEPFRLAVVSEGERPLWLRFGYAAQLHSTPSPSFAFFQNDERHFFCLFVMLLPNRPKGPARLANRDGQPSIIFGDKPRVAYARHFRINNICHSSSKPPP